MFSNKYYFLPVLLSITDMDYFADDESSLQDKLFFFPSYLEFRSRFTAE